jgi:YihY family inner membrane protein
MVTRKTETRLLRRMKLSRAWTVSLRALRIFSEIEAESRAAAFAYYALFSLFPLLALFLTLGTSFVQPEAIVASVERFFPMEKGQQELVWSMSDALHKARGGVGAVSLLALLWGALRFFQSLVKGVHQAWHHVPLPWWKLPLKNLMMTAIVASAMGIGLAAPALLQLTGNILLRFQDLLAAVVPGFQWHLVAPALDIGRFVISGALLFYAVAALYILAPGRRIHFREVWMPALAATLVLQLGQVLFGHYAARFIDYNAIYGSVGALMLALMWVYLAGMAILLGACFSAASSREDATPSNS